MKEYTGWLFDLYLHPKSGIKVWLVGENGRPYSFQQEFPITFYAGGPAHRLRGLWKYLKDKSVILARTQREDLYAGTLDVMEIRVSDPVDFAELFKDIYKYFPDLAYYDVDIPLILRYAAEYSVFPLAYCKIQVEQGWNIEQVIPLDTPWELDPKLPDLRILHLTPDCNPAHAEPKSISVQFDDFNYHLDFANPRELLSTLNVVLRQFDPDVILTSYGDTWLFTRLEEISQGTGIPFNPNRDPTKAIRRKKEISFHNYGQAHYRGEQVHLFGRWHIDDQNCMTFADYGLTGAIEQARATGLPVQEIAKRSPGAGIAAMQTMTALRRGVLVPYRQQKGEVPKTYDQLFIADRGGLVFEPLPGIFPNVAIIDFISMYPSIMVEYNISPETVASDDEDAWMIPDLNVKVSAREGLVPETLRPMRDKRVAIKRLLKQLPKTDPRYSRYKAVSTALKWLSVVAYGRLGYANSTFGRINSHEAVTHIGRQMILRAKQIAEDHGFTVLHIYVDSLFIQRPDAVREEDFQSLLDEIQRETRLPIEVEDVYSWMAFVSARHNPDIPVANRFFGLQGDGEYKLRGLALRRGDTPQFVAETQQKILQILANEKDPGQLIRLLPDILEMLRQRISTMSHHEIPLTELVITQTLSRELANYRVPSPVARAAMQLQEASRDMRMGQHIQFIFTRTEDSVLAWDLVDKLDPLLIDTARYKELLFRASYEVLQPLGVAESTLRDWLFSGASYIALPSSYLSSLELSLFANLEQVTKEALLI